MLVNVDFAEASVIIPKSPVIKEMISVSTEGGKPRVKINSSSVGIIQECPRKALYVLQEKWRAETESPATLFGSAIHKALEVFYRGEVGERYIPDLSSLELMSYGHRIEGEETDLCLRSVRAFIDKAKPLSALPEMDKRSIQNGVWILHSYFKTFLDDPYVAYVDEHGPFVEREFTFRLHESDSLIVDYFGTIDIVLRHLVNGNLLPGDHKTTSMLGGFGGIGSYYDREKPNSQYTGYLLGAREAFGIKSNEFMVNVIEVKARPKTARGSIPTFPRQITTRDENDFAEFRELVVDTAETYLRMLSRNRWPLGSVNSCNQYAGCSFRQVCAAPKELRPNILSAKFTKGDINEVI